MVCNDPTSVAGLLLECGGKVHGRTDGGEVPDSLAAHCTNRDIACYDSHTDFEKVELLAAFVVPPLFHIAKAIENSKSRAHFPFRVLFAAEKAHRAVTKKLVNHPVVIDNLSGQHRNELIQSILHFGSRGKRLAQLCEAPHIREENRQVLPVSRQAQLPSIPAARPWFSHRV